MKLLNYNFLSHTIQYIYENVSCLLYGIEILPEQTAYFSSYFMLVKDIAEAYGSWIALTILILSALLIMVSIQQVLENKSSMFQLGVYPKSTNINRFSLDYFFTNYNYLRLYFFRK